MGAAFTKIKRLIETNIGQLSPEEKQQLIASLRAGLSILGGVKVSADRVEDISTDYLTHAIRHVLIKRKVLTPSTANRMMRRTIERLSNYAHDNELARNWIEDQMGSMNEAERQYVAAAIVNMLLNHLNNIEFYRKQGVGPHELMSNISRIPSAVESELPGYARSGLLRLVLAPRVPISSKRKRLRSNANV